MKKGETHRTQNKVKKTKTELLQPSSRPKPSTGNKIEIINEDEKKSINQLPKSENNNTLKEVIDKKDKQPAIANGISFLSLIIATVALFYTYQLFLKTIEANQTTSNALRHQISKDSQDAEDKKRQDLIDERDRLKRDSVQHDKDTRDRQTFDLQRSSTQAQIEAFKEQSRQFKIENRPVLLVVDINVDTLDPNKKAFISFKIQNFGKTPAVLDSALTYVLFKATDEDTPFKNTNTHDIKTVVPNGGSTYISFRTIDNLGIYNYISVKKGKLFIYLHGQIFYSNGITLEKRKYYFICKITSNPYPNVQLIKNDDILLDD